jgi:uncharacterized membrane protein YcaP (DUF421 family)
VSNLPHIFGVLFDIKEQLFVDHQNILFTKTKRYELVTSLFGKEDNLNWMQMSMRGIIVFITALIIMRIGSAKTFGKESAIDSIVMIVLGGNLSRTITGAAPFIPVMASTVAIIIVHRLLAWICMYNHELGNLIKGKKNCLYADGQMHEEDMKKTLISKEDLQEGLRQTLNEDSFDNVDKIMMERNGKLSVVKRKY